MPKIKQESTEAESKKASLEKYAPVIAAKAYFTTVKATAYNSFWTDLQNSQKNAYQTD
jgi:hypothetical protein